MKLFDEFLKFDIDEENLPLRREQVHARLAVYPTMVVPAMCIVPLLVWVMWEAVSHGVLLGWMALAFAVQGFELWQWWHHRHAAHDLAQCRHWDRRFRRNTMLGAAVWGLAWLLMYVPDNLAYQILIICLAMGFAAGGVTVNPVHRPSMFLYLIFLLVPLILRLVMENDKPHWLLALMLVVFSGFMLSTGLGLMRTFELSLRQRFEKEELLHALRQREEALAEALNQAEQANLAKSKFLATASHDLRQPLQALRLFTEALLDTAKEKEVVRLAGQIGKSVDALVDMFDDLLDISRLDAGIIEPRCQHFPLSDLFDRLYVDCAVLAQSKGLRLAIPTCEEFDAVVYSDPFLLERMLRNLLSNAIRYTDQGEVVIDCRCEQQRVELAVNDSGIGMRPEEIAHIFDEYYQANNPHRDRHKGLGLGLSIVRRIEKLLGYSIAVVSQPGMGSSFRFSVPSGDPAQQVRPYAIFQAHWDVSGTTIALVEDDVEIRESIAELMRHWGCSVHAAEDVSTLLHELDRAAARPDLLVSDYRLPRQQTALDVMRDMRARWSDLPVLVLTGDTGSETLQAIRASGAVLLHKPVAPARLRAAIHRMLQ